jgi:hypothetical protein
MRTNALAALNTEELQAGGSRASAKGESVIDGDYFRAVTGFSGFGHGVNFSVPNVKDERT